MIDFDKVKEAQARQGARRDGACDVGCAEDDADRALLVAAVPWLLTENARLTVKIAHLEQYERGDLIPGKVATANLAAAGRWILDAYEASAVLANDMGSNEIASAIRERGDR